MKITITVEIEDVVDYEQCAAHIDSIWLPVSELILVDEAYLCKECAAKTKLYKEAEAIADIAVNALDSNRVGFFQKAVEAADGHPRRVAAYKAAVVNETRNVQEKSTLEVVMEVLQTNLISSMRN